MDEPRLVIAPPPSANVLCDCGQLVDTIEIEPDIPQAYVRPCGCEKTPDEVEEIVKRGVLGQRTDPNGDLGVLGKLLADEEIEYSLYRTRSTDTDAPYATLALSATCTLNQEQYERVKAFIDKIEEVRAGDPQ